jgi:hypothetical protein
MGEYKHTSKVVETMNGISRHQKAKQLKKVILAGNILSSGKYFKI